MSNRQLPDGLRRLNKLADLLESQPPKDFDLSTWHCGTACCAVGFAASHPYFRAEGLGLTKALLCTVGSQIPIYDGSETWSAIMRFFELDADEADTLFHPQSYDMSTWRNSCPVVMRIRALVASKTSLVSSCA